MKTEIKKKTISERKSLIERQLDQEKCKREERLSKRFKERQLDK